MLPTLAVFGYFAALMAPVMCCLPKEYETKDGECCLEGHGLFAQQECTATTDTICDVLSGYFCKDWMDDAGCSLAKEHTPCPPGHRIKEPGTSRTDTVCELCQPGHFSQDGLYCTAWTICSATQVQIKEGSSSSDVVCGAASRMHFFCFISVIITMPLSLALVIAGKMSLRKSETSAQSYRLTVKEKDSPV